MPTDFKNCYETLGLTPDADWRLVQSTYRQLLIRWHPDRHQENKVTADHAKQHFISLSTSFNALRDFQRQHKRLPLQSEIDPAVSETSRSYPNDGPHVGHRPDTGSAASNKPTRHAAELQRERLKERRRNAPAFDLSDEQLMDASLVKEGGLAPKLQGEASKNTIDAARDDRSCHSTGSIAGCTDIFYPRQ